MKSTKPWKVGRTMQNQVGIGKQDFAALRESQCFYIDKTDFIRQWWNYRDDVTLITRPGRFGKTLNMSMLNCFFSNKYADRGDLFEGLDICSKMKNLWNPKNGIPAHSDRDGGNG